MNLDPLDRGEPGIKEWEEFRSGYAAAFLLSWLSEEATDLLEEYADDLHGRFMSGWDIQDLLLEPWPDEPPEERPFPLPPIGGVERDDYHNHLIWMDDWEAQLLYQQLFPHRDSLSDFPQTVAGLAVVALHAAFEAYVRSRGIHTRGPLPRAVEGFFHRRGAGENLDAQTMRWLIDCDATRHVLVHNRGVVDERYIRSVAYTTLQQGEFRRVTPNELRLFARAVWKVAALIRAVAAEKRQ